MAMEREWTKQNFRQREMLELHRPLEAEYSFYEAVKSGDVDFVRRNCEANDFASAAGMGRLSDDDLQNIRYHFIITAALVSRFCIEGGMELELAYGLSDFYIVKMDRAGSFREVVDLHHVMVMDFAEKMRALNDRPNISKAVHMTVDYIYLHLHSRIKLEELAAHAGVSPGHLSRLFAKEMGVSVSEYISDRKIKAAENLLKYSNMAIVDIASHLAFASQSYFIHVFSKRNGITPRKYREKFYRSDQSFIWNQNSDQ